MVFFSNNQIWIIYLHFSEFQHSRPFILDEPTNNQIRIIHFSEFQLVSSNRFSFLSFKFKLCSEPHIHS